MKFFSRYKRPILIILFIIFTIVMAYLLYIVFFRRSEELSLPEEEQPGQGIVTGFPEAGPNANIQPTSSGGTGNLPEAGGESSSVSYIPSQEEQIDSKAKGGITKTEPVINSLTINPTINNQTGDIQYYDPFEGKFYKISEDGTTSPLSNKVFHGVQQVTWSKNADKAVLEYPDGSNVIYDFNKQQQVTLPKHWESFDFSPDGNQLVMKSIGMDVDSHFLATANSDGSGAQVIEFIGENDQKVYPGWSPNNQVVALYAEGLDYDRQTIYFLGLHGENFKSMVVPGRGFQYQWSPQGDKMLYSVYSSDNEMKPMLWIADASGSQIGENRQRLNLQTWAEKCTFASNEEIYCAVPTNLDYGAGLMPALANQTPDYIYKINTKTGSKQLIAIPDNSITVGSMMISPDGSKLFLTDKNTGVIRQIKLR